MDTIFEHYSKILDSALETNYALRTFLQSPYSTDTFFLSRQNIRIEFGVTRGAIVDEGCDWIVKFELNEGYETNHCEKELAIWEDARRLQLMQYFCPCVKSETYNRALPAYGLDYLYEAGGASSNEDFLNIMRAHHATTEMAYISISFYLYRRATCNFNLKPENYPQSKSTSPLFERNPAIGNYFFETYGQSQFDALTKFCIKHHINDIHKGNVGWLDGHLVIIDYAGFHEEETDGSTNP